MGKTRRKYTREIKLLVIREMEVGVTVPDELVKQFPKVNWDSVAERALK